MKYPESKSKWQKKIIIQQVLKGEDYRILVVNGKFAVGTHRLQARVTGDGKSTIAELIEAENTNPKRDMRLPTHTLKPIVIDKDLKKVLAKQDLDVNYVPKKDEVVRVRDVASMSQGGITADVTDHVHPQIKLICESIAQTIHAYVLGVDVLCQDISKPLTLDNGGIIEMNTMPEMYLNVFPVIGREYPEVPEMFVKGLVGDKPRTRQVVVLGDLNLNSVYETVRGEFSDAQHIGCIRGDTMYIDEKEINAGLTTDEAVLSIKKNGSLDTIILHYESSAEIEQYGFGFNTIDLMIAEKAALEPIRAAVTDYQDAEKITKIIEI